MKRPCEQTYATSKGRITPKIINNFASDISGFCSFIQSLRTAKEIKSIAKAVRDNWERYGESC